MCKYNVHAETHFGKFAHRNYDSDSQCFCSSRRSEMFNLLSNFQASHQMPFVFYWFSLHGFVFVTLSFERTTAASIIFFFSSHFHPHFLIPSNSSFHFNPICTPLQTKLSSNPRTRWWIFFPSYNNICFSSKVLTVQKEEAITALAEHKACSSISHNFDYLIHLRCLVIDIGGSSAKPLHLTKRLCIESLHEA